MRRAPADACEATMPAFISVGRFLFAILFIVSGAMHLFDLAGTTSNAGFSPDETDEFLTAYFGKPPATEIKRSHAAMQCASLLREAMWSMVSEIHLSAPGADYESYTDDNLARLETALQHHQSTYGKL